LQAAHAETAAELRSRERELKEKAAAFAEG
jgi:hypothetical protein